MFMNHEELAMSGIFRLICGLMLLLASLFSQYVQAETCLGNTGQMTLNFQNIKYLPTLRVNTQMSSIMPVNGGGIRFTCDRQGTTSSWKKIVYQQMNTQGGQMIDGHAVFNSALPGIGYSLSFQCDGGPIHFLESVGSQSVTVCDSTESPSMLTQREVEVKAWVTFYKTADIRLVSNNHAFANALANVGNLSMVYPNAVGNGDQVSRPVNLDLAAMNVDIGSSGSCSVTRASIFVDLGKANRSDFKGPGTSGGSAVPFSIPVYCATPTDIRIGFFATPATTGVTDTLDITHFPGGADGVGIRIRYGDNGGNGPMKGTSVTLNEPANLPVVQKVPASSAATAVPINFLAQMVQTGSTVTAGRANGTATFVLEYN